MSGRYQSVVAFFKIAFGEHQVSNDSHHRTRQELPMSKRLFNVDNEHQLV